MGSQKMCWGDVEFQTLLDKFTTTVRCVGPNPCVPWQRGENTFALLIARVVNRVVIHFEIQRATLLAALNEKYYI